jgi:UbiD family decarboxylase
MLSAKGAKAIPPDHVGTGSCKEVKIMEDDVDLTELPVSMPNNLDDGNYTQILETNIIQHPTVPRTN